MFREPSPGIRTLSCEDDVLMSTFPSFALRRSYSRNKFKLTLELKLGFVNCQLKVLSNISWCHERYESNLLAFGSCHFFKEPDKEFSKADVVLNS